MKKTLKNQDFFTLPQSEELKIVIEAGAEVWIEDKTGSSDPRRIEVTLEADARLRMMTAFSKSDELIFHLKERAHLQLYHYSFGTCEDRIQVVLEGADSRVFTQTVFFGSQHEEQGLRVDHVHLGERTHSHMISRGAVQDQAKSHFFGNIVMEPGCTGADGQLEEHNLLLSPGAKIEAIPGLEIRHNEVQASHSATLERVDNEKLFYLQSRGLSPQEGLELLVEGFFWDSLKSAPDLAFSKQLFKHILSCLSK